MEEVVRTRLKLLVDHVELLNASAKDALTRINEDKISINEAQIIVSKLKKSIDRFISEMYNYYKLIEKPSADELAKYTQIQINGEELAAELEVTIQFKTKSGNPCSVPENINVTSKLPKMELAKFDGDVLKWHQFWDQFSSNVHNRHINDVDKLLYLQSVLEGDAKRAIEGLETTNKNYEIAVSTLRERYGKPGTTIDAHYAALYKIKTADKSAADTRRVYNEIERHLRVLSSLGEDVNHNHLRVMIMQKFSEDLIYELRMKMGTETDSIENIRKYLEQIISAREASNRIKEEVSRLNMPSTSKESSEKFTIETMHVKVANEDRSKTANANRLQAREPRLRCNYNRRHNYSPTNNTRKRKFTGSKEKEKEPEVKKRNLSCVFCGRNHFNDECDVVKTIQDRKKKLNGRCFNCLAKGHRLSECRSHMKCRHCEASGQHNRALCPTKISNKTEVLHVNTNNNKSLTVLQTAVVRINKCGGSTQSVDCRVLLDCGSQRTYVVEGLAKKLDLPVLENNRLSVFTFGASRPREIESPLVKFRLISRTNYKKDIYANVVAHITNAVPNFYEWSKSVDDDIVLADNGSMGDQIDILIGNDYYHSFMSQEKLCIAENLYLVNSCLGWIWSGKCLMNMEDTPKKLSVLTYFQSNLEYNSLYEPDPPLRNDNLKKLWDLESLGITDSPQSSRDDEAIKRFNETTIYTDNRYQVKWPWMDYPPLLPSNFGLAMGRLTSLLKRLEVDDLHKYDQIIREQLSKGIIEIIPDSFTSSNSEHPVHYLPHHCVSSGDKLRIVYDASAKVKGNKSLNECLYRGPLMLEELTGLLIRFREHRIGIIADVEKAFLQVGLQTEDRDVTRFLWLKNVHEGLLPNNLLHLRFCRVPFGVISSPFLLNATIRHHLIKRNTTILRQVAEDLYVDNLVTGSNSSTEAIALFKAAKRAFDDLSMNLREWNTNSKELREHIPDQFKNRETEKVKVLGLEWNLQKDELKLRFSLQGKDTRKFNTKREVLRVIASVFDPCGYVVPILLPAKLFLQSLWSQKIPWDNPFTGDNRDEWFNILRSLENVQEYSVPRYFAYGLATGRDDVVHELHCFTDASMKAYAAVVYMRSTSQNKTVVTFVAGKSRLVSHSDQNDLKIPKLELLGVVIGSRLIMYVQKFLRTKINKQFLWTDSQIVLSWCATEKLLPPFVARRIDSIKKNPVLNIRYVPSQFNPADGATRPNISTAEMTQWLSGPEFLRRDITQWPKTSTNVFCMQEDLAGQVPSDISMREISNTDSQTQNHHDQTKDTSHNKKSNSEVIFPGDIDNTDKIRKIQQNHFPKEINLKETNLSRSLGLYKDEEGLLRCRGRYKDADWPENQKHPILLPKDDPYTIEVIEKTHNSNYHVGVSHTLSLVRKKYWIVGGRSQVQKVLRKCQACRKYGGGPYKLPPMAPLPPERITYSAPFTFLGIDYFGPLVVDNNGCREKRWVCLLTCLAVRAIHMETVVDLTAEECLLALRRFIASRGLPKLLISDNALYFKLTSEVLTNGYCIERGIKWKFIPELAPWFGGFYERLIGLVKHCLKRTLDKHLLNHTQLCTVIKEAEAVVNSRPLTFVGGEVEQVLRPTDFLCLGKILLTETVDTEFLQPATTTKVNLIEGWKRGQRILQEFVKMFTNQYLLSLRDRRSYHYHPRVAVQSTPRIGDIVQIKGADNRALWKVGRISAVVMGSDGQIRVAKVTVSPNETLTRSISHLYPLEMEDELHDDLRTASPENELIKPVETQTDEIYAQAISPDPHHETEEPTGDNTCSDRVGRPPESSQRPQRLSAQKAREKVKKWTSRLLVNVPLMKNLN